MGWTTLHRVNEENEEIIANDGKLLKGETVLMLMLMCVCV